jgi:hypothetical protein
MININPHDVEIDLDALVSRDAEDFDGLIISYQGMRIDLRLPKNDREMVNFPRTVVLDIECEGFDLVHAGVDQESNTFNPGDGMRININGRPHERLDRRSGGK